MLPVVKNLRFNLEVNELGKTLVFRPMNIGEKKLLLTAIQMQDPETFINTIMDILQACFGNQVEVKKLPNHLIEYLYLNLHIRSQSDIAPASFKCNKMIEKNEVVEDGGEIKTWQEPCNSNVSVNIPLTKSYLFYPENYEENKKVMLDENVGIKFKVPCFEDFKKMNIGTDGSVDPIQITDKFIFSCIDCVFDAEKVYNPGTDFDIETFKNWVDGMDADALEKMNKFFSQMPVLSLDLKVTCPNCKTVHDMTFRGLDDFFG